MLNIIKAWGIGVADLVNNLLDPYDDFTRPFLPPDQNTGLNQKAKSMLLQLMGDFTLPNGLTLYNRANPANDWEVPDFGDQAVHHGLATAALALAAKNGDVSPAAATQAARAIRLFFENGKLVRGRDPRDATKFGDDASNDSASGAICGIYFSWKHGGTQAAEESEDTIRVLADELAANDYALLKQDGTPTTYGKLINGLLTDPQRSSLALAIFKAAHVITGEPVYAQHFAKLNKSYGGLLRFADFKFLDYTKSYEAHRSAIHLHILADCALGDADLAQRCAGGLARIWSLHRKTRDPWLAALVNRFWRIPDLEMREVVNRLYEYPIPGKPPQRETINSAKADYWKAQKVRFITVNGTLRASQPIPYHMLPSQDFWPQRHPFMCDGFAGATETFVRHNPVDFLAPYELLRLQSVVSPLA